MGNDINHKLISIISEKYILHSEKKNFVLLNSYNNQIESIFFLESGFVKQTYCNIEGNEMILNIYKPNSYFPLMLYMSNLENKYTFTAITKISFYKIPVEEIYSIITKDNELLLDLANRYAKGLSGLLLKIESLMFSNSYNKLAELLIYFSQEFGVKSRKGLIIEIYLTHNDLSSYLGIQRETVSKQFEIMESQKIIGYYNKFIIIKNLSKLKKLVS